MSDPGEPKRWQGSLRDEFPEVAAFVDAYRAEFGAEAGGRLSVGGVVVRRWGMELSGED